MKRRVLALVVMIALLLPILGLAVGTGAQGAQGDNNDIDDLQATAEAQETEIADLGDDVDDLQDIAEAQETEIADLEERVAELETVVAGEDVPQATPVADEPARGPGEVLYEADESGGFDEWTGPSQWLHRDGTLVNDGTAGGSAILAPYQPNVSDYAVEAEIRLVRCNSSAGTFGLIARAVEQGAYRAGHYCYDGSDYDAFIWAVDHESGEFEDLAQQENFTVDAEWHTYRLEVRGDMVQLFIDGEVVAETADLRYANSGEVGMWSTRLPIEVRSFRVLAL
jgi:hypothetical protein